jgi:D-sedoheptulose 7-phosphate isomerase|tara:strand:+ start:42715 stop:43314 length:600 start_codon:yes stop_codon:yes gene_type:complete
MNRKEVVKNYFDNYKKRLFDLIESTDINKMTEVIELMINAFKINSTIYVCGNGGSAATASHMQADFSFFTRYFTDFRPKVKALTDNLPLISAIGNDKSFDQIFVEQLKGNFKKGDILICISASGNSKNLINAVDYVKKNDGKSIGFLGFDGGELLKLCDISLYNKGVNKDYGPIEDVHMIFNHFIVNYLSKDQEFLSIK